MQSPLLIDQLQLEPGSGQTLLIFRDAATGAIKFVDNVTQGGILLHQLAGLRSVGGILVVGKSGAGAAFTTIQAALDTIPANSSVANPYLILVGPGVYTETVNIARDGVVLIGLGGVTLQSALEATPNAAGADHTLIISAANGTVPQSVVVENIAISNAHTNKACVRIVGLAGSNVGAGQWGIRLKDCHFRPVAAGGNRPVWATGVNKVLITGGSNTTNTLDLLVVEEVADLTLDNILTLGAVSLRWDNGQAVLPSGAPVKYLVKDCPDVAAGTALTPLSIALTGASTASFNECGLPATLVAGDRATVFRHCTLGNLTVNGTSAVSLIKSTRGTVNSNANASLLESMTRGTVAFAGDTTKNITLSIPQPSAAYSVDVEVDARPANDETAWVTNKAATGFTINFQSAQNLNAGWKTTRTDA